MTSPSPPTLLDTLGEEIIRIVAPVSACMLLLVLLVSALSSTGLTPNPSPLSSLLPSSSSSPLSLLLTAAAFVALVTALTFALLLLFYLRCTPCLKAYMALSAFLVLAFLGSHILLLLLARFQIPLDAPSFLLLMLNFSLLGVLAVFANPPILPIALAQAYLVLIGVFVAYWFTLLPEWTTWALLVAMALYDLAAVLLPGGPLRLLLELAMSRDEELPALVYEARPVDAPAPRPGARRLWRGGRDLEGGSGLNSGNVVEGRGLGVGSGGDSELSNPEPSNPELSAPLVERRLRRDEGEEEESGGIGLGASGAIKLGLGDFIFYSVLVGRAAMYDYMTVYACYLAIIAGLGITLLLLAFYRRALPALPFSIGLGVVFYLLTRFSLEGFVVECSANLLMF